MDRVRTVGGSAIRVVAIAYLTALAGLLLWSHLPKLVGWQSRVVLTGSMAPSVRPGDVAALSPVPDATSLPAGRIALVRDESMPSGYYLHRVLRHTAEGHLVTKGDANRVEDTRPVEPERVEGQLRLVVPKVGLPVVWLRGDDYLPLAGITLATWVMLLLAFGAGTGRGPVRQDRAPPDPLARRASAVAEDVLRSSPSGRGGR